MAAPTVPEYRMSCPTLYPLLIPEKTRSGFSSSRFPRAAFTQSPGVPSTAQACTLPLPLSHSRGKASSGLVIVMRWDMAEHWPRGAQTAMASSSPGARRAPK